MTYAYTQVHTYSCICVRVYICTHFKTYIFCQATMTYIYTHILMQFPLIYICAHFYQYTFWQAIMTYTCTHIHMYWFTDVYMYPFLHVRIVAGDNDMTNSLGSNIVAPNFTLGQAFLGELLMTFLLCFTVCVCVRVDDRCSTNMSHI